ncbi:MAG: protease inhibitor I42 family protein [Acidobacteriota bacterium]|nr:protease inhibitor I42 family protein [Acidobacteriota bacterium]
MSEKTITIADHDSHYRLQVGDRLILQLPENPTTGFCWTVPQPDSGVMRLLEDDYRPNGGGIGGGGLRVMRFEALGTGKVSLETNCWQEWERVPQQTFVLNLEIV